ncbi:MAG: bile acid:sodium symporter family protein [Pseudomonadota bacterium]
MSRFLPDRFVMLMMLSVILALIFPQIGASDGPLKLGLVTQFGIALIFFLHGANLAPENLVAGLKNWRVHVLIQSTTFVIFPILGLILYFGLAGALPESLRLGFFFLAALPSTISSAVAMTALAKGNVPVAVFNATLSGLLGLILTPAMISLITAAGGAQFSLIDATIDIARTLLLPFIVGQLVRPLIKTLLTRYKPVISLIDRGVILLIVFSSFASSTASGIWSQFSGYEFAVTIALVLLLLAVAFSFTTFTARRLSMSREDEAATVFCGSTKSLANGAPIAQVLFAGSPMLGVMLLPLMLYHQLQLMGCAILAQRYAKSAEAEPEVA